MEGLTKTNAGFSISSKFRLLPSSYTRFLLPSFAFLSVSFSLWMRVVYRGPYYPGWDVLGPAHGLFLVSTRSFWDAFSYVFNSTRNFQYWNHTNSLLYTLIPGYLGSLWPWEYWAHLLTFFLFILTLWLIIKFVGLPIRQSWILLLAWGASSVLLSFSIAGYPYVTGLLPHALALWITLHRRIRQNWLLTLLLCLVANELSWHLYEAGKTLFIVFIAAALLHKNVPLRTRGVWLLASALQLNMVLSHQGGTIGTLLRPGSFGIHKISTGILNLGKALLAYQTLDIPVLFVLGVFSLFFFRSNRWFFLALLMFQIGLVFVLAMQGADWIRPRRFLLVEFYCIVSIVSMFRESHIVSRFGERPKAIVVCFLIVGNIWQISDLIDYFKIPVHKRHYPMPFTYSQADYTVPFSEVNWYLEARSRVDAGEKLLLIYNFSSYPENTTDPAGALERLYLSLGHERFVGSVLVFGSIQCRYSCLPIRPLETLEAFLDDIRAGGPTPPEIVTVHYLQDFHPTYRPLDGKSVFELESTRIFSEIRKRFAIRLESPKESRFMRLTIAERAFKSSSFQGFVIEAKQGQYEQHTDGLIHQKPFAWRGLPLDITWVEDPAADTPYLLKRPWGRKPFSLKLSGKLRILEKGHYDFLLGSYDGAILKLDGRTLVDNSGMHPFQLTQCSLALERGSHHLELTYTDAGRVARLLIDISRIRKNVLQSAQSLCFETVHIASLFPKGVKGRYYKAINWSGENKETGPEILIGEALEAVWTSTPGPSEKPWNPSFSLRLEGEMNISEPGTYLFVLGSDDGSFLYLDGTLVLDNGGNHVYQGKTVSLYLRPGKFNLRLDYFDIVGEAGLKLSVRRPRALQGEVNLSAKPRSPALRSNASFQRGTAGS